MTVILFIIFFANDSCQATAPIVYLVLAISFIRRFQLESEQYYTESLRLCNYLSSLETKVQF